MQFYIWPLAKHEVVPGYHWKFSKAPWPTIGDNFHTMINLAIAREMFHDVVTKGFCLISKDGDTKDLHNWRSITMLTLIDKIYAKALQLRLQPLLMEAISPKHTFHPLRCMSKNIFLVHESLH